MKWVCVLLLIGLLKYNFAFQTDLTNTEEVLRNEFKKYTATGAKSHLLSQLLEVFKMPAKEKFSENEDIVAPRQSIFCSLCRSVLSVIFEYRRAGMSTEDLKSILIDLCTSLQIDSPKVCYGTIGLFADTFMYIVDNRPELTPETTCGIFFQSENCVLSNPEELEWSINIDNNGPPITGHKATNITRKDDDLVIAHFSDVYYDPRYVVGSNGACEDAACCRTGVPASPAEAAGVWGYYSKCDTPWQTVLNVMEQIIKENPKIDFVYYTGDTVDHGVWETSIELIQNSIIRVSDQMDHTFKNVPVFSVFGNHEAQPVNQFPPPSVNGSLNDQWLFETAANKWGKWLTDSGKEQLRSRGYYSTLARPGLRVIGLNNNIASTSNFWLVYDIKLPAEQLQWLHDTLLEAEKNNEKVHILAHFPPGGGGLLRIWSREFKRITDRFWNTISGVFNGHSHRDEFSVFYSRGTPSYAVNVAWNGGGATTGSNLNHNYHILYADSDTYQVTDYDNWIFNLTEANLSPNVGPRWYKTYSFKDYYGVQSLSPANLNTLVETLAGNRTKLFGSWLHKVSFADPALERGCNDDCLTGHLCLLVATEAADSRRCQQLLTIFRNSN